MTIDGECVECGDQARWLTTDDIEVCDDCLGDRDTLDEIVWMGTAAHYNQSYHKPGGCAGTDEDKTLYPKRRTFVDSTRDKCTQLGCWGEADRTTRPECPCCGEAIATKQGFPQHLIECQK